VVEIETERDHTVFENYTYERAVRHCWSFRSRIPVLRLRLSWRHSRATGCTSNVTSAVVCVWL
jgi:hypothetical protein